MGPKLRVRPAVKSSSPRVSGRPIYQRPASRGGRGLLSPSPRREGERHRVEAYNPPHPAEEGEGIPGLAGLESNLLSQGGGLPGEPVEVPEGNLGTGRFMSSSRSRSVQPRGGEECGGSSRGESFLGGTLRWRASERKIKESKKTEIEEQQRQLKRTGCHPRRGTYPEVGRKAARGTYQTRIATDAGASSRASGDVKREYSRERPGSSCADVLQYGLSAKQGRISRPSQRSRAAHNRACTGHDTGRAITTGVRRTDPAVQEHRECNRPEWDVGDGPADGACRAQPDYGNDTEREGASNEGRVTVQEVGAHRSRGRKRKGIRQGRKGQGQEDQGRGGGADPLPLRPPPPQERRVRDPTPHPDARIPLRREGSLGESRSPGRGQQVRFRTAPIEVPDG
eukprot:3894428-Amphidinium_carterae.1